MVCPDCYVHQTSEIPLKGILEVNINKNNSSRSTPSLKKIDIFDLLPIEKKFFPEIPVGNTPLLTLPNLRNKLNFKNLFIKDDTRNPTASFKDRASYLVAAEAIKYKIPNIVVASTGNAASSMAGIGAASAINITIFLPRSAPIAKIVQSLQYGAQVVSVDGNYDKAYDLSMEYVASRGGLSRNTGYNPLTIEGKKTVSLEIARDLEEVPDYVFVPTGDGVILSGVYKGFRDLFDLKYTKKIPTIVCVQAEGSNAITRAFRSMDGHFDFKSSSTIADSISVDIPRCGILALKNLMKYKGECVTVSDDAIIAAQKELSSSSGVFAEPAAATAFAGFLKMKDLLEKKAKIVLLMTGNGLKDTAAALKGVISPTKHISSISEIE
ncbi:MAG: pyridoxal-phosphate dependent enzyme [Oligoflexia bacterium]|nr:pyridoxal-phosphate dependent enzyme [Oligoflexia bacterium]